MAKAKKSSKKKASKRLSAAKRRKLPAKEMGLPDLGKYPVDTPARARNAKARAAQELRKGNLTPEQARQVIRKADAALGGSKEQKASRESAKQIISSAKKAKGGKLPKPTKVAKTPRPGMGKKKKAAKKRAKK